MIGSPPEPSLPNRSSPLDTSRIPAELRSPSGGTPGPSGSSGGIPRPAPASSQTNPQSPSLPPPPPAPGLREQIGATRDAARSLFGAHIDLAKAEIGDIASEARRAAILGSVAFAALLIAGFLLPMGLSLFLGEWLFGSIGWGVLHGTLLLVDVAVAAGLLIVVSTGGVLVDFVVAVVLGIISGIVLGANLTNRGWTLLGDQIAGNISADIRPLVVAAASLAIVFALLVFIGRIRSGIGAAIGGAILGAILGLLIGVLTAIALDPQVGAAVGVTVAFIAWPILMGIRIARQGVNGDELKAKFWPDVTIETTKETIEWVRQRMPLGRES